MKNNVNNHIINRKRTRFWSFWHGGSGYSVWYQQTRCVTAGGCQDAQRSVKHLMYIKWQNGNGMLIMKYLMLQRNTKQLRRKLWCPSSRCWLTLVTMPTLLTFLGRAQRRVCLLGKYTQIIQSVFIVTYTQWYRLLYFPCRPHLLNFPVLLLRWPPELP